MIPQMLDALFGFEETVDLQIIQKTITDHEVVESFKPKVPLYFQGVLLALHPRYLLVKPEGERQWKWWTLYSETYLDTDWVVKDMDGRELRVMARSNWEKSGFYQYELTEGPTD